MVGQPIGTRRRTWRDDMEALRGQGRSRRRLTVSGPGPRWGLLERRLTRQVLAALVLAVLAALALRLPLGTGDHVHRGLFWLVSHDSDLSPISRFARSLAGLESNWDLGRFTVSPTDPAGGDVPGDGTGGGGPPAFWIWPAQGEITAGFGWREDAGEARFANGLDFSAPAGAVVMAAAGGRVARVWSEADEDGLWLEIDHGDGWTTRYGNCAEVLVNQGDAVEQGQGVARVGPGSDGGGALTFEMLLDGVHIDPEPKLQRGREGS